MEKCNEYFDCRRIECIMFDSQDKNPCWEVEGTICWMSSIDVIDGKVDDKENCDLCLYKINNFKY